MIKKVLDSIKKEGIFKTIKKCVRHVKYKIHFWLKGNFKKAIKSKIDVENFETIIIFENNFGWNKLMKQRPQQIAENLPDNTLMFYHSHEKIDYPKRKHINILKDNLVLLDLGYYRNELMDMLSKYNNKYLMIYSTDYIPYDRIKMYEKGGYTVIYEYVDDLNEQLSGKEMHEVLYDRHTKILKDSSLVVCTSTELYKKIEPIKKDNCILITNGGNYEHFKYKEYDVPDDLTEIRDKYENIICYYGALANWFDYKLIKKVATNKDYGIVLIGQDYDQTLEKSGILDLENVFYLGRKNYDDLPKYGCNADVFIIPFLINDITLATSPVKIFEYMAMERPIVTTALPECKKYKSVLYSKNDDEFVNNIKKAIALKNNKENKQLLVKEARENTWCQKAGALVKFANTGVKNTINYVIDDMFANSSYDRIVVWRSPFGWDVPLFQRPQHIARQFAKLKCLVLYEVTTDTDDVPSIKKEEENLYLVNFDNAYLKNLLESKLKEIKIFKYVQFYSTNWSMSIDELNEYVTNGYKILYEYIDDINPDLAGTNEIPPYIIDKYNYAMENEDVLVVTTAKELYDDVVKKRGKSNMAFSTNGVDYSFYQNIDKNFKYEHDFLKVINNGKINVGYYGALASWFDYDLIEKINATNKYNIILFGVKYDESYDKSNINSLKNVHFFGSKEYKVLKNYACKMDILMIPFVINSITKATSPLKLFEYMALHKPIITTAMNECKNYKSVKIANNSEEFLELLDTWEIWGKDKEYIKLLDKEARANDWFEKAKVIVDLFEEDEKNNTTKK